MTRYTLNLFSVTFTVGEHVRSKRDLGINCVLLTSQIVFGLSLKSHQKRAIWASCHEFTKRKLFFYCIRNSFTRRTETSKLRLLPKISKCKLISSISIFNTFPVNFHPNLVISNSHPSDDSPYSHDCYQPCFMRAQTPMIG